MKNKLLLVCLLFQGLIYGQIFTIEDIAEAESKAARDLTQFRANANTGNYDLTYHRLELNVDPASSFISGDVTSHFIAKQDLSTITFDLDDNMVVSQVIKDGVPLGFVQNNDDELVITLPQIQNQGVLDSLTVSYSGNPVSSGFGSYEQTTHNGDPIIWTLSEPYGAKAWWPCKQDLIDKIDEVDIYLITPEMNPSNEEYIAVSNGVEQSQVVVGNSKTTHYKHQYPIPAYLIAIAVTNYEIFSLTVPNNGNPFDIVNYVFPEDLATAQADVPVTVDIMNLFTDLFEEYPFVDEKYGHAQFGWSGGMEHTTVSFMGNFSRNLIAHELAHQWFGNKITCGSWRDIWLNEGFATYLSGLVVEGLDGDEEFKDWREGRVNHITQQPAGAVYLSESDTTNVSRIFNSRLSYSKGAMVLHMLRREIGDANFYQGLQDYLVDPDHAFGYAKTEDFIPIMEQASGQDLTEFFDDWVYKHGYPTYTVAYDQISATELQLIVDQEQSHGSVSFFEAPLPIRILGTQGEILDVILDHTSDSQLFNQAVNFTVDTVLIDPDFHLISKDNSVLLSTDEFSLNNEFKLYPNPTEDELFIEKPSSMTISSIRFFNVLGQLVKAIDYAPSLQIEDLSSGLHFVRFETNQGNFYKSIIKD